MSLFVKIFTNFYSHRKTIRLRAALGDDAYWIPPRLWAYAAENQPDGDFSSYSASEIAALLSYTKEATSMLQALLQAGFLDPDMRVHNWSEHNSYHKTYAERASKAADARWSKQRCRKKEVRDIDIEPSIASSMLQASPHTGKSNGTHINGCNKNKETMRDPEAAERYERMKADLTKLYNRSLTKPWNQCEMSFLVEISRNPECEKELGELKTFRKAKPQYFPQSVEALLRDWDKTLDRSRIKPRNCNNM